MVVEIDAQGGDSRESLSFRFSKHLSAATHFKFVRYASHDFTKGMLDETYFPFLIRLIYLRSELSHNNFITHLAQVESAFTGWSLFFYIIIYALHDQRTGDEAEELIIR